MEYPNSQKNTTLLSIIKAGDGTTNIHVALDMYKTHVQVMQGMSLKVGHGDIILPHNILAIMDAVHIPFVSFCLETTSFFALCMALVVSFIP